MKRRTEMIAAGLAGLALGALAAVFWQMRKRPNGGWSGLEERGPRRHEAHETNDRDIVQEASEESFPASDPPAW
jgi:hypothetical protein